MSQNFRNAVEDIDPMDRPPYPRNRYEMTTQGFLQHQIPRMPAFDHYSSNDGTANKLYNSNYTLSIASSAYEHGLPPYISTVSNHHITARGNYPTPQGPEHYQRDNRKFLAATGTCNLGGIHESMPIAGNLQRDVSFLHRRDSEDSGVSMSMDKTANDSTFSHNQNSFYGFPRGVMPTTNSIAVQKTLPSSSQADFGGQVAYEESLSNEQKNRIVISLDNTGMWLLGNASAGHGHYQNV